MRNFTLDYLDKLDEQWREIDILIDLALKYQHSDINIYNSLCRSTIVLCVSHMENFYKAVVKNLLLDLKDVEFCKLPKAIKQQFCRHFVGYEDSRENNEKIERLISEFEKHGKFSLPYDAFLPSKNKNPKPTVIETVCTSLGTKKIFQCFDDSIFDDVFSMTEAEIERFQSKVDKRLRVILSSQTEIKKYFFKKKLSNSNNGKRTLWESFFDDMNTKRHDVAHGNIFSNSTSTTELREIKNKCKIFQHACILALFSNIPLWC